MKNFIEAQQEQDPIIRAMKIFQYTPNGKGICFGIACRGLEVVVADDVEAFKQHLAKINNPEDILLYSSDILADLNAFFYAVHLYNEAISYSFLFEFHSQLKPQDPSLITPLVMSLNLESLGGMVKVDEFLGCYHFAELLLYLQSFSQVFQNQEIKSIGLFLQSSNHAITLGFYPMENKWLVLNPNKIFSIQEVKEIESLSSLLQKGFFSNKMTIFSTFIYVINKYSEIARNRINIWHQTEEWQSIQRITPEKLRYQDPFNHTWLSVACQNGHLEDVSRLIISHSENKLHTVQASDSLIYIATRNRHLNIINTLFECELHQYQSHKMSPLFISVYLGYLEIAAFLLEKGMNPNEPYLGVTPLEIALISEDNQMIELLYSKNASSIYSANLTTEEQQSINSALIEASKLGYNKIVDLLIKKGAHSNDKALLAALQNNASTSASVIRLLLNAPNQNLSYEALDQGCLACIKNNNLASLQLLLNKMSPTNKTLNNYLRKAIKQGSQELVILLLKAGTNPIDKNDYAAFYCASKFDSIFLILYDHCIENNQIIKNDPIIAKAKRLMEDRNKNAPFWNENKIRLGLNIEEQKNSNDGPSIISL